MVVFPCALRTVEGFGLPPPAIAPADNGVDAVPVAQRVLDAALQSRELSLYLQTPEGRWLWRGSLAGSTWHEGVLSLHGPERLAQIDTADVIAVSTIADDSSGGLCLFVDGGGVLAIWTTDRGSFDAWLAAVSPGFTCPVGPP
jgi:hypothetical protein